MQTSVVAILVYQSTHAIHHVKGNFRLDDVLHDAVDWRAISTNTLEHAFLLLNNQNWQQSKLVTIVNGNGLIKHNYWTYVFWTQMSICLKPSNGI